jgi:hypothetical protein
MTGIAVKSAGNHMQPHTSPAHSIRNTRMGGTR